jgi:hypothetical protein
LPGICFSQLPGKEPVFQSIVEKYQSLLTDHIPLQYELFNLFRARYLAIVSLAGLCYFTGLFSVAAANGVQYARLTGQRERLGYQRMKSP